MAPLRGKLHFMSVFAETSDTADAAVILHFLFLTS
jgi:hypothetical protein